MTAAPMSYHDTGWVTPVVEDEYRGIVASVDQIDAWMTLARAGDRMVYATRAHLPARSAGGRRMMALAKAGLVCLTRSRSQIEPDLDRYIATRTSKASALTRPERATIAAATVPIADGEAAAVDALLPVLTRFASAGRPCPTDRQLAERAGLAPAHVPAVLAAMVQAHLIRIQGAAAPTNRRVVIVATGAVTGIVR